jgi:hypothetical protein
MRWDWQRLATAVTVAEIAAPSRTAPTARGDLAGAVGQLGAWGCNRANDMDTHQARKNFSREN